MTIHLVKLCVGADVIDDVREWQTRVVKRRKAAGEDPRPYHVTRMFPKRRDELLDGGSLYWVVRRVIQVRQEIVDLEETVGDDGIRRCRIVLDPALALTQPSPRRAFQGWRYLRPDEAPADLPESGEGGAGLPEGLRRELIELGAW